jgi:TetR/AcrR family transcriptional regulator
LNEREIAGAGVGTPWGEASNLRARRLFPGSGTPPEDVARNQRERLFGAIVAVVSDKGYEAATVADVLALSGVSRSAFYRHFTGKADCLVAAVSELLDLAVGALRPSDENGGRRAGQATFEDLLRLIGSQPAASRVCFIELHAAGEDGEKVADQIVEVLAAAAGDTLPDLPAARDPALMRALVGGLRKLIHTQMVRGEEELLPTLAPDLWRWIVELVPPPDPLEPPRRQRTARGPAFQGYTPGERIAGAVATVVAENGFAGTTTDAIAAHASISLSTFYAHFSDKHDAVLAALEMSGAQITALAVPAARRAGGWQEGVRALYEAICAYFAAEPAMASLALVGVYGAGPRACRRRDHVIDSLTQMLAPGFTENPQAPKVSADAIAATVYALMREQLRRGGPASIGSVVPLATYITLVGFVGPDQALEVANGRPARR